MPWQGSTAPRWLLFQFLPPSGPAQDTNQVPLRCLWESQEGEKYGDRKRGWRAPMGREVGLGGTALGSIAVE